MLWATICWLSVATLAAENPTTPPPTDTSGTITPPPTGTTGGTTPPPTGTTGSTTPPPTGTTGSTTSPPTGSTTPPPTGTPGTDTKPPVGTTGTDTKPPVGTTGTDTKPPAGTTGTDTKPPAGTTGTDTKPPAGTTGTDTKPPVGTTGTDTKPPVGTTGTDTKPPVDTTGTDTKPPVGTTGTDTKPPAGTPGTDTKPPAGTTGTDTKPPAGTTDTKPPVGTPGTDTKPPVGTPGTDTKPPVGTPGTDTKPPVGTPGTDTKPPVGTPGTDTKPPAGTTDTKPPTGTTDTKPKPTTENTVQIAPSQTSSITITDTMVNTNVNAQGQTFVNDTKIEPVGHVVEGIFSAPVENHGSIARSVVNAPAENHGLISNSTLTPNATVTGGMLTGTVNNQGTVTDLEFVGINLTGGTLAGTITNNSKVGGVIQDVQLSPQATLKGGKVGGTITAAPDSTLQDIRLVADTSLNGGILKGNIAGDPKHPAQLTNVEIAPGAKLSHVTLIAPTKLPDTVKLGEGVTILKHPPLDDATRTQVEAGNFNEVPLEKFQQIVPSQITKIPPAAFANLKEEQLAQLDETAFGALTPAQVAHIPPTALTLLNDQQLAELKGDTMAGFNQTQVAQIPPTAFTGLKADQMTSLTKETVGMMTPAQFAALPMTTLAGVTTNQIEGLTPMVIHNLTTEQLNAIPPTEIKQAIDKTIGKILVNLDPDKVSPAQVAIMLPDDWQMDLDTGRLTPPAQTVIALPELSPPVDSPPQIVMPVTPDLSSGFGIGGVTDTTILDDMNETLQLNAIDFTVSQDPFGIVQVQGTNDNSQLNYSFLCRSWETQQVSATEVPSGVQITEDGFIQITTTYAQQFTMVPAPKDPVGLSEITNNNCVMVGKHGEVFLQNPSPLRSDRDAREVVMFDALIEPAPEEFCQELDGETVCDFNQAPLAEQPGIHDLEETSRAKNFRSLQRKKVVYSDGTSQQVYPTVLSPAVFIAEMLKQKGVEQITFQDDGTFKLTKNGKKYTVYHNFDPKSRPATETEMVEPSIVFNNDQQLTYTIEVECATTTTIDRIDATRQRRSDDTSGSREVLEFDSYVEEDTSDSCAEIDGEVICETDGS